jgi:hypothetical protein
MEKTFNFEKGQKLFRVKDGKIDFVVFKEWWNSDYIIVEGKDEVVRALDFSFSPKDAVLTEVLNAKVENRLLLKQREEITSKIAKNKETLDSLETLWHSLET